MIRAYIHNYNTEGYGQARRDGERAVVEITDRLTSASWSMLTRDPYEVASVRTSIKINELKVLGIGVGGALHASGWLELRDEDIIVFYGIITRVSTGLSVDTHGARRSQGVTLTANSWLSLIAQPFKLTALDSIKSTRGLYDYDRWAQIFERVFAEGASQDVALGLRSAWRALVPFITPTNERLSEYDVLIDSRDLNGLPRALERVRGANLSQVPTSLSGSLWQTFTQTFAPTPQLIELFPIREQGKPALIYRMKPLPPSVSQQYFAPSDRLTSEVRAEVSAHRAPDFQPIDDILSYSLDYRNTRNNYIEVTSSYLGISPLAGLVSRPYALSDDIDRYGLHPVEITYPLIRKNEGSMRDELEDLTRYASALHSEGHAFGTANVDTTYQPHIRVGEWARWFDYVDQGTTLTGYVTGVQHKVNVDSGGRVTRRTSVTLERVSQNSRPSAKSLVRATVQTGDAGDPADLVYDPALQEDE